MVGDLLDDRYQVESRLGAGGMSVVWRAWDRVLERAVAVKVLAGAQAAARGARQRIQAEARAAAGLWHPHVTSVYDYGEHTDAAGRQVSYVVMELLPGQTLSQRLAAGPLPPASAMRTCAQVAEALAAAHERKLVHRDIKPSNVMLTPAGVKVVDFGIATTVGRPELEADGQLLGTAAYLAPERLAGGTVLPASDVYALGLLLYRTLTNELPWSAETPTQMLSAHVYVDPAPLPDIEGVSPEVHRLLDRCLARDPADRPDAAGVATALHGLTDEAERRVERAEQQVPEPAPTTVGSSASRRRRIPPAVLIPALLATAATISLLLSQFTPVDGRSGGAATRDGATPPGAAFDASATEPPAPRQTSAEPAPFPRPSRTLAAPAGPAEPTARAGSSAGPGPTTSPSAEQLTGPSSAAPAPTSPKPGTPLRALGGVVTVLCTGDQAHVVNVAPAPGYSLRDYNSGPVKEIQVVLLSAGNKSEIKARCEDGTPLPKIKESPQP
ncbi:serine/threonine-protein kinase [Micromonospora jinlongensis]|uniref:non-specific serine/threonine protein kinase n=1 Tax=Micromonospora jinlongensis TaxID=1287877 RepID=A0A7Y9WYL5_9ACTN|nr:serine/threonine-protein kinase [Micromonospora jinlongensis]NYH41961.1 serine/threonine-protein kinase [Micromonospora jinlongensis]